MRVAVIGAGVMGLATGWALRRRGHDVVVYEQFAVGNPHGSSHGRSRIFRLAYAEPEYVRLAQEASELWRELEAETGEKLLELNGLVEVVRSLEESTAETLEACGVAWERLDREEAERRYPIHVPEESFVVVQPEAGITRADLALKAFAQGLDVREDTRVRPDQVDADAVVVTAGSWVNELLDEPLDVKTTRETLCYFRPDTYGRPVPSVVSFKPDDHTHDMYSLADPKYGLKVGAHHAGPEADPNVPGEPEPDLIERITTWARGTYLLADPDPVAAETCMYTSTPDQTFILERRGRIVVGSPCSGHGFKFAPAIGERLATLAEQA
ncbi:MAG: FAD-dependent oxidoreductase [Actinobacteria bacterium]|nr:MAG: FAD-dependent oxidoreductase [Actinomycetota bacterium]